MAIPDDYIDKITKGNDSRMISPAADMVRVDNDNFEGETLDEVLDDVAQAIGEAGEVKSVSVNNGTPSQPDAQGNVNLTVEAGADTDIVSISVPNPYDGTVVFTKRNGDTVTVNINHTHPQYLKYELLEDEAAYNAIATKDSSTLYLIPEA
jgi:hypothetical protein